MGACTERYEHSFSIVPLEDDTGIDSRSWQECVPVVGGRPQWDRDPVSSYGHPVDFTWPRDGFIVRRVHQFSDSSYFRTTDAGVELKTPRFSVERVRDMAESYCDLVSLWEDEFSRSGEG